MVENKVRNVLNNQCEKNSRSDHQAEINLGREKKNENMETGHYAKDDTRDKGSPVSL